MDPSRWTARPHPGEDDDAVAHRARVAVRGRAAWVYASPSAHGRLRWTGADGHGTNAGESLAVRVAGLAINGELAVVVPAPGGAVAAVPVPFGDGRIGALVVACGRWGAVAPRALETLGALAEARASHGTPPVTIAHARPRLVKDGS